MWSIVCFEDEVETTAIVPNMWLDGETHCWWPNVKDSLTVYKLTIKCSQPNSSWGLYSIRILRRDFNSYDDARSQLDKSTYTSDLNSDEEELGRGKRIKVPTVRSSSDDDNYEDHSSVLPPFPRDNFLPTSRMQNSHEETFFNVDDNLTGQANIPKLNFQAKEIILKNITPPAIHNDSRNMNIEEKECLDQPSPIPAPSCSDKNIYKMSDVVMPSGFITSTQIDHCKNAPKKRNSNKEMKMLRTVITKQDAILAILNEHSEKLCSLSDMISNKLKKCSNNLRTDVVFKYFPLKTDSDVANVENLIKNNKSFKEDLIQALCMLGGDQLKSCTSNIMLKLISFELGMQYSFCGQNNNKEFRVLELNKVIKLALRQRLSTVTDVEMNNEISSWLRFCANRLKRDQEKKNRSITNK